MDADSTQPKLNLLNQCTYKARGGVKIIYPEPLQRAPSFAKTKTDFGGWGYRFFLEVRPMRVVRTPALIWLDDIFVLLVFQLWASA